MLRAFLFILLFHTGIALWAATTLVTCELFLARGRPTWRSRLRALRFWALYLPFVALVAASFAMVAGWVGLRPILDLKINPPQALTAWLRWPLIVAALLASAALSDFFYYWMHRAQHRFPLLWRFHAVHHSIRDLNAVNSCHHLSEEVVRLAFIAVPVGAIVRIEAGGALVVSCLIVFQMWLIHAPLRIGLGPLRRLLSDGHFHRIHHSLEDRHRDLNFGAFTTLWDQLFGTAHFPEHEEWPDVGLSDAPEVVGVADYLMRPFRAR